ncbi:gamma carbonic anhydrase family protein [Kocuria sediminis]|uniref:Gamma carbonic anhydrase family protein n=1 Tax=Kocuria sediminis TaxID=1038857 RepID=A0A6N8GMN5_9MICC|nr:gamma carbonic anhydrase family protein [Kocuria sediminis]MUN62533.1 gamma carbonic anhydrase family protein [Kocuria sediminis]
MERPAPTGLVLPHAGRTPRIAASAFVAPTATVVGDVELGADSGVFYGAVVRGDRSPVRIGAGSNLQDNVVVHSDPDHPCTIGAGVSVGHGAVVHGCTVEDEVLVGMNATVLNGAVIGSGSLVAAGAVVLEGTVVPPGSLVAGVPAKVRRELTEPEREKVRANARTYVQLSAEHRELNA